ncbi:Alpha/Beta hydrolase protein [Fusarium solani]|uniref:Alpha/Beta hydrolase protein n=1 Tax=Fusarium solani TaxID=169388 RepID=A0A9P9G2Q2_FUSSL|nr:Alpha/Beta hydrolase protein [Fusarium solani]KAH7230334.1 Alpha/Beta hydrolase protein [Fusarium solani]
MTPSLPLPRRETVQSVVDSSYIKIKNAYVPMRDGAELCVDIFLPLSEIKAPCLLSMGPYGKDIHAAEWGLPKTDLDAKMNRKIVPLGPDACMEHADPIIWTKEFGYALMRADTRGIGGSPGRLDPWGLERSQEIGADAEGQDLYDLIEWAGVQDWCTGRVAMSGISYLGMVCWTAAMQKPPHLTAILPWEAATHLYDFARQGGIENSNFTRHWYTNAVLDYQHGVAEGVPEEVLIQHRVDWPKSVQEAEFRGQDTWSALEASRKLADIQVPLYSAGNWMDTELHLPGNVVGFQRASSKEKWLEMHSGNHLGPYYDPSNIQRQRQFLDYFMFDKRDNGLLDRPKVDLVIRKGSALFRRGEAEFPPADTRLAILHFLEDGALSNTSASTTPNTRLAEYPGLTGHVVFTSKPLAHDFELLGTGHLNLTISAEAADMDIFVVFYDIGPDGERVIFTGNHDEPTDAVTRAYFRLSHRGPSDSKSVEAGSLLAHASKQSVEPNHAYSIQFPMQPCSYIWESGHRIGIEVAARDSDSLLGAMRHEKGDRLDEGRFNGANRILAPSNVVLPNVERSPDLLRPE